MKPHRQMPALCVASALLALGCGSDSGGTSNNPPPAGDVLVQNDLFHGRNVATFTANHASARPQNVEYEHVRSWDVAAPHMTVGT